MQKKKLLKELTKETTMSKIQYFEWIQKVILSCTDINQIPACMNLVDTFHKRCGNWYERQLLVDLCNEQTNKIWMSFPENRNKYYGSR